jgi:hypothetical protein
VKGVQILSGSIEEFTPRWGGSVFDCDYCGAEGMQWTEVSTDKWIPFDLLNNEIHECPNKNADLLIREQVLQHLQSIGFEAYVPRTSSWKYAFTASNKTQTIYFLVGKRGIDFKFYDHVRSLNLDEKGKIFTDGGELVRNYYKDNEINVHELVLEIASIFVANNPIDRNLFSGQGKSWAEQKVEYIRGLPKSAQAAARDEIIDIYDGISCGVFQGTCRLS